MRLEDGSREAGEVYEVGEMSLERPVRLERGV